MPDKGNKQPYRQIKSSRPGDHVLRVRTRKSHLTYVRRGAGGAVESAISIFKGIFTETPILPVIGFLACLVLVIPIPIFLVERTDETSEVTSYGIGLWWAVSAFTTVGHSDIDLVTVPGRIIGSIYTIISVGLFFGSVIAAFSSYFLLTWRKPKRQVIDTITYYLQRLEDLNGEELEDLEEITAGVLKTARERAAADEKLRRVEGEVDERG